MPDLRELPKRANACSQCRARKVKCDGGTPCSKCHVTCSMKWSICAETLLQASRADCFYPASQRGRQKLDKARKATLESRMAQMEAMIQGQNNETPSISDAARPGSTSDQNILPGKPQSGLAGMTSTRNGPEGDRSMSMDVSVLETSPAMSLTSGKLAASHQSQVTASIRNSSIAECTQDSSAGQLGSKDAVDGVHVDKEAIILAPMIVNWEHHGPGSWLSVCSRPGLDWVSQRTGVTSFDETAKELIHTWTKRLTLDRHKIVGTTDREPDSDTAWKYCNAYFEDSFDSTLGLVYKPKFESALRAHLRGDMSRESASWFALRKTVYATGCRIYLSKNTSMSFTEIQAEAWGYFQSAMSVLIELLFTPTGLLAIRALIAMTFFSEGLGNPALEYMLCANAARLAQAKGLHRRPAKAWNLSEHDELHHSWLFWAIYCCEKHIAHRSGRPSAIDDDDISCQIPSEACSGSTLDVEVFTNLIRHAQISSRISRQLMSVKAFQQPSSALLETAAQLNKQLRDWRDSLPPSLRPEDRLKSFQIPRDGKYFHAVLMHYTYYGSLMATHTIFAYPWVYSTILGNYKGTVTQDQIVYSSNAIAEAARNIIIITRSLDITGASIQWPTFYYPIIGLINLFIHILKFPTLPSTRSDIALLEVAAGYFSHMEFITSAELSFPFARDVAALARQTVNRASEADVAVVTSVEDGFSLAPDIDIPFEDIFYTGQDFNLDDWSIFSSILADKTPLN